MKTQMIVPMTSGYNSRGKVSLVTTSANRQVALLNGRIWNSGGATNTYGIARKFATPTSTAKPYKLFTYDNSTFTEVSLPIASNPSIFDLTNNHGFAIQGKSKWGVWGITVAQASTGAPVYEYTYWNGSSFVSLQHSVMSAVASNSPVYSATGDQTYMFGAPPDWMPGGGSGLDANMYTMRVRATTAPTQAVQISDIWVGAMIDATVAANTTGISLLYAPKHPVVLEAGEGLMPFFGVASTSNYVSLGTISI